MRVAIVTITELNNVGNRLQNYALQRVLSEYGVEVETIPNYICFKNRRSLNYQLRQIVKGLLHREKVYFLDIIKQKRFNDFDKKYLKFSPYYSTIDYISPFLNERYDYFIAGSDQIWNPYFTFNYEFNFLTFAPKHKRIAYAASFGVENIPDEKKSLFRDWLTDMEKISVREFSGQSIVKDLTGKEVPVLLDPTMLLTKEEWNEISKKPKWMSQDPNKYMLVYTLGNEDTKVVIDKIKTTNKHYANCKVILLNNVTNGKGFCISPDEFIWLVAHASVILTDSFHGTVFSILFGKPFVELERKDTDVSMRTRLESLFQLIGITFDTGEKVYSLNQVEVETILQERRKEAVTYLEKALKISK